MAAVNGAAGIETAISTPARAETQIQPQDTTGRNVLASILEEERMRVASRYQPVMGVDAAVQRYRAIKQFVEECMESGVDYGKPEGFPAESKPFLYKPGAQKLCAFFGYVPHYEDVRVIEEWTDEQYGEPLFFYKFRCVLLKDGAPVGEGMGSCNSWESKYRYRHAARTCPACGAEAIIKGLERFGGGWVCWKRKGGCDAKFPDNAQSIVGQQTGRVANEDIADTINTILKQAEKRAYVEATLSATGASAFFSQDEDAVKPEPVKEEPKGGSRRGPNAAQQNTAEQKIAALKEQEAARPKYTKAQHAVLSDPLEKLSVGLVLTAFQEIREPIGESTFLGELRPFGWNRITDIRTAIDKRAPGTEDNIRQCLKNLLNLKEAA